MTPGRFIYYVMLFINSAFTAEPQFATNPGTHYYSERGQLINGNSDKLIKYAVHIPRAYDQLNPPPLIVSAHGYRNIQRD